ncbi:MULTISPECIES: PTS IIA-like nitrogen regulatory protein PtsN [Pseudomonas]|jgi:PTS system nitrogen regulatory IIA component|uniref:PTS fructose transporter subunit IIA n=2 Tax=Pseudomonas abyssi TaxID=170540 RepID=A0ACD6B4R1_9PSED|nr:MULTISPECIES: PTS IIA-like nitrogen regulatory protein PtsN [Pseudomonadaceae]MAD00489.1 PTS IIA-like nitrogen-regulatory protein PtsN [Pseudomonadales bacterium]MAG65138.1 PTS IIA-like nitrogen-regulatory protein PtsN [Pseudomonadales bacterium]PBK06093.1 PTS IIA-like nitrogen-regulatory protein PtsN [Pseudomonas abyssi]RGP54620.1 PTS fructose transporter subunit IIA [Halopseudomonas gallaeciensis]|tara:strand:+ start:26392 stop:26850 length:459 start_codon:yes stop_codon:yes gene_type:complete
MQIDHILTPERTFSGVQGGSKKRVLELIGKLVAQHTNLDPDAIYENLIAREKLGSTGFGNGIAIPHCRLEDCHQAIGALLQLDGKIDFDALDGQPVDLIFVLLVPQEATEQHLQILKMLAGKLDRADLRDALRAAPDADALYHVMVNDGDGG